MGRLSEFMFQVCVCYHVTQQRQQQQSLEARAIQYNNNTTRIRLQYIYSSISND